MGSESLFKRFDIWYVLRKQRPYLVSSISANRFLPICVKIQCFVRDQQTVLSIISHHFFPKDALICLLQWCRRRESWLERCKDLHCLRVYRCFAFVDACKFPITSSDAMSLGCLLTKQILVTMSRLHVSCHSPVRMRISSSTVILSGM